MYEALEQLSSGEFTGFIIQANSEDELKIKLDNAFSEETTWFINHKNKSYNYIDGKLKEI